MSVQIVVQGNRVRLVSPYNPALPARAKALGGRFNGSDKSWEFDSRDEARVRELARSIYGTDGSAVSADELVTVQVDVNGLYRDARSGTDAEIWFAGRAIVVRTGRDTSVRLGQGVVLISGGFPGRGGSAKYPEISPNAGTVVEVRDVPRAHPDLDRFASVLTVVESAAPVPAPDAPNLLAEFSTDALIAELRRRGINVEEVG